MYPGRIDLHLLTDQSDGLSCPFGRGTDQVVWYQALFEEKASHTRRCFPAALGQRSLEIRWCIGIPGRLGVAQYQKFA